MVTREFLGSAARAWRSAACSLQRPEIYDTAASITSGVMDLGQLAAQLEQNKHSR